MVQIKLKKPRVAYISTYIPRKCGIATFTKDLTNAINLLNPAHLAEIIAIDTPEINNIVYPWEVRCRITKNDWPSYEKALIYLNRSNIDLVVIQHEFGIWGGNDGEYVIKFLEKLKKPCVIVFHTVLSKPTLNQREITNYLCRRADAVVVMLRAAADLLRREYGAEGNKILVIHHGVPDFPRRSSEEVKLKFGFEDKIVMSSINLLSESKGIEYAIQAVPKIIEYNPNFIYLVIGETHPIVKSQEGEKYRTKLEKLVKDLKLESSVKFVNQYLSLDDLISYIQASNYYITPYLNSEQAASGSLAYAIGAGKVCVSTNYLYAKEMLRGGKGLLVPFLNSNYLSKVIIDTMKQPQKGKLIEKRAYSQGRLMTWPCIALDYLELFSAVLENEVNIFSSVQTLPKLDYIRKLTKRLGILEHSNLKNPDEIYGYTVDDNAKALIVALCHGDKFIIRRYFTFIYQAEENGLLHNNRLTSGDWQDKAEIGDWWGKAFWSVCCLISLKPSPLLYKQGLKLLMKMYRHLLHLDSPRTISYVLLGLCTLKLNNVIIPGINNIEEIIDINAQKLVQLYRLACSNDWQWFESMLTYDNTRLSQALLQAARVTNNSDYITTGKQSLDWFIEKTFDKSRNCFSFIGCNGWCSKGELQAVFDQQPVEADAMVEACVSAYYVTKDEKYIKLAKSAFDWYDGNNILQQCLIDSKSGGIYDGLTNTGRNKNLGAESVLSYHLAYFSLKSLKALNITQSANSLW